MRLHAQHVEKCGEFAPLESAVAQLRGADGSGADTYLISQLGLADAQVLLPFLTEFEGC